MEVFHKIEEIPASYGPTVVSIGNFDGVHCAHQRVLKEIAGRARALHAKAVAITFEPHPARILRPDSNLKLITPAPEKLRLLAMTGIDATLLLPFSRDLSLLTPGQFAERILNHGVHAIEIHEGYNFHFGHKAEGNVSSLVQLGKAFGFATVSYQEMRLRGEPVSSSRIRELLSEGNVSRVRPLLGRPFSIVATPGRGRGFGSKYTVPTINLSRYDEMTPADGVYITRTVVGEECFDSVTNVGNRPTFGDDSFAIETHLLNFHPLELTPETRIQVFFLRRIRDEIKFPSVEALREQIGRDVETTQRYFRLTKRPASNKS